MVKPLHSMIKLSIKYGLIGTGVLLLIFWVYYFLGKNPLVEMGLLNIFILPIFLFFGVKEFRDYLNRGYLLFWEGMTLGFGIYFLVAFATSVLTFVFLELDTTLISGYIDDRVNQLTASKTDFVKEMGESTYLKTLSSIENTTAFQITMDGFLRKAGFGLIYSGVISVVMKRKQES